MVVNGHGSVIDAGAVMVVVNNGGDCHCCIMSDVCVGYSESKC